MSKLNEIVVKFTGDGSKFYKVAGSIQKELKKMVDDGTLGALSLGAAFGSIGYLMKDTLDTMDQISKMSQKTGFSVESLSALKYAAELSDVSVEDLETSFVKLNKAVDGGSKTFDSLGIKLNKNDGTLKSNEEILMEVADAFSEMEDGAAKTAAATEIFGRSGAKMIPLLNGGSQAIREQMEEAERLGITFDTVAAQKAERFNDSITTLTASGKGFVTELVTSMLPAIDTLSDGFEGVSGKADKTKNKLTPLQAIARGIAMGFLLVSGALKIMGGFFSILPSLIVDAVKALGRFGEIFWLIVSGQWEEAKKAVALFDRLPLFGTTGATLNKLGADIVEMKNAIMNTALGTQHYGGSNLPTDAPDMSTEEWLANRGKTSNETSETKGGEKGEKSKTNEYTAAEKLNTLYRERSINAKDEVEEARINLELKQKLYELAIKEKATQEELDKLRLDALEAEKKLNEQILKTEKEKKDTLKQLGSEIDKVAEKRSKEKDDAAKESNEELRKLQQQNELNGVPEWMRAAKEAEIEYQNELYRIDAGNYTNKEALKAEAAKKYSDTRVAIEQAENETKLGIISDTLGAVAGFFGRQTAMYKTLAMFQATIDAYAAGSVALRTYPPPFGAIAMVSAIATGLANVATIAGLEMPGYATGGFAMVGEAGPEIIAPVRDYAAGQVALINATVAEMQRSSNSGSSGFGGQFISRVVGRDLVIAHARSNKVRKANRW